MRRSVQCAAWSVWLASMAPAVADELIATRPGVMCASPDALARLTLPNGDSRTHAAAPRPDDLATASAGGCVDIPSGVRVTVRQAFRNTSLVTFSGPNAPAAGAMMVPNVDFEAAGSSQTGVPPGLAAVSRLAAGGGLTVVLLMDKRLTPTVRAAMEGSGGDPDLSFERSSPLYAEFTRRPPLNAMFVLEGASGAIVERKPADRPLASVEPVRIAGLPHPALFLTVNYSSGVGGWSGPATELVVPAETGLKAARAAAAPGKTEPIALVRTLHAGWQVTPSRAEILSVFCNGGLGDHPRQEFETFRFAGDHWTVAARLHDGCDEIETLPARREFP